MSDRPRVLLVDDEESILTVLEMRLESEGYDVVTARDGATALAAVTDGGIDVVISDLRLESEDGLDVMDRVHEIDAGMPVLILTAHGSIPNAVEAMNRGAAGYLTKPVDKDKLFSQMKRCLRERNLQREVATLRRAVEERSELCGIVGSSAGMRRVFELIERVAPTRITTAIYGESGTGKELVARALHDLSPRANRDFLAINCAALPEQLLQSELFGYKRGAFTGAQQDRAGLFQQANGGTLFLDEIGDLSASTQVSLLRVLQESEVMPIGGRAPFKVDVRVVVATHRDLKKAVEEGKFREDLYYRVNVASIHLPPLRDRGSDLQLLADHFLGRYAVKHKREVMRFSDEARAAMLDYTWPGNVRELQHAIERTVVMADHNELAPHDLFPGGLDDKVPVTPGILPLKEAREQWEKEYLTKLLESTSGNVSAAARAAGKYRADLYTLLRKHDLDPSSFKSSDG